ncbi:hypothetical protein SAMN05877753_101606 [Bacillus oleivorans]|uniref:Uncharacterized protein n=1 Tax=Bacillus oleivorans TaxID=1448271 RepID=A0A285CI59_9BACI|nr:hypothetical protein [Bacillus oleivorans]SNX67287.1 hypothetical protein SAMN05877753_101606 [Bacillus oleivorans]
MEKTEKKIDLFILIVILGIFIFIATYVITGTENLFRLLSYVFFAFIFLLTGFLTAYLVFIRDTNPNESKMRINFRHVIYGAMTLILVALFIILINDTSNYYDQRLHFLEKEELPEYLQLEGLRLQFMLFTAAIFSLIFTLIGVWLSIKREK